MTDMWYMCIVGKFCNLTVTALLIPSSYITVEFCGCTSMYEYVVSILNRFVYVIALPMSGGTGILEFLVFEFKFFIAQILLQSIFLSDTISCT